LTIGSLSDTSNTINEFGWYVGGVGLNPFCRGYFDDIHLIKLDSNCVTDLNEIEMEETVKLYPNPISNQVNIRNKSLKGKFQVKILEITGRLIQNKQFSGIGTHTLNLNGLAQGIYYFCIIQGNEVIVVEKLFKVE
jgi:hypothetical protein